MTLNTKMFCLVSYNCFLLVGHLEKNKNHSKRRRKYKIVIYLNKIISPMIFQQFCTNIFVFLKKNSTSTSSI